MSSKRNGSPLIRADGLEKTYHLGKQAVNVLRGVSVSVGRGEFAAIVGASGSGKSTLLHLLGLLDEPDRGKLLVDSVDVGKLSQPKRNRMRCRDIGFVFQFYHLQPELNVLENALLPAMIDNSVRSWLHRRRQLRREAEELLEQIGLGERLKHRPRELSGGERQRVALARALMNGPEILLADEPTGNLDSRTGEGIMSVLQRWNTEKGQTILMVTHDAHLAREADRVLHLCDGRLG